MAAERGRPHRGVGCLRRPTPPTKFRRRPPRGGASLGCRMWGRRRQLPLPAQTVSEGMLRTRNVCETAVQTWARRLTIETASAALQRGEVTSVQARTRRHGVSLVLVRVSDLSCAKLLESAQRAAGSTAELNAYITHTSDLARRAAELSDERRAAGQSLGLLDGVPVAVKVRVTVRCRSPSH